MDNQGSSYNVNFCRICQNASSENSVLIDISESSDEGRSYWETLKYLFDDIDWVEDSLRSSCCKKCLTAINEIAVFKSLCCETNYQRFCLQLKQKNIISKKVQRLEEIDNKNDKLAPKWMEVTVKKECDGVVEEKWPQNVEAKKIKIVNAKNGDNVFILQKCQNERKVAEIKQIAKSNIKTEIDVPLKPILATDQDKVPKNDNCPLDGVKMPPPLLQSVTFNEETQADSKIAKFSLEIKKDEKEELQKPLVTDASQNLILLKPPKRKRKDNLSEIVKEPNESYEVSFNKYDDDFAPPNIELKNYTCRICKAQFKQFDIFERHALTHTGARKYGCNICGRKYVTYADLIVHSLVHSEDRYMCPICPNKRFKSLASLRQHNMMLMHIPYSYRQSKLYKPINTQPLKIKNENNIIKVEKKRGETVIKRTKNKREDINKMEKEFHCKLCNVLFCNRSTYDKHRRSHKYQCNFCDQKFVNKYYIRGHLKWKHDMDIPERELQSFYFEIKEDTAVIKEEQINEVDPRKPLSEC